MESQTVQVITSAVAPIVMVSAAGLLSMGVQTKNLHLADHLLAMMSEYRALTSGPGHEQRRNQIVAQVGIFRTRISLSQRALQCLYVAMVTFVLTSLLLAATSWTGGEKTAAVAAGIFVTGVALLLIALALEFAEMRLGMRTVDIEISDAALDR